MTAPISLRDITCLKRIQATLKLYEDASSSKMNFSKTRSFGLEHTNIELINQDKCSGYLKYFEFILVNLSSMTPIRTK